MARKSKIDWNSIKISIVPANKDNFNPHNPCSMLTKNQREEEIVFIAARIWARAMKEEMLKAENDSNGS